MDDSIGTLIYILIAVVGFIISALGKKKKRDAKRTSVENYDSSETVEKEKPFLSNIEKLLNEELGIQNNDPYMDSYEVEEEEEPAIIEKEEILDKVPKEMLDDKEDIPYSIEYEDTSKIFSNVIKDKEIIPEDESNEVLQEFSLEEAIIYSEILNRKEY